MHMQPALPGRDLYIFKGILTLFLEIACSKEGCLVLASSGVIRCLASSKLVEAALDSTAVPVDAHGGVAQLREISTLTLQILLALCVGLPESRDVAVHVREFLERHSKTLFGCLNKSCLPMAGLVMSTLSNLFRQSGTSSGHSAALDPFFVAQCRGHIVSLAWDLLPPTAARDAVVQMRENATGHLGPAVADQAMAQCHDACRSLMDITISCTECLKTMADQEDEALDKIGKDLLDRSLLCSHETLLELQEVKHQVCSYLENGNGIGRLAKVEKLHNMCKVVTGNTLSILQSAGFLDTKSDKVMAIMNDINDDA